MRPPLRVANCSGFYGDRSTAAAEMVNGGPIDVLTGDWLAELTMLILARTRAKHPRGGYARTFVTQMESVMGTCLDRGIKIVSNAGGLDPDSCAEAVAEAADKLGLAPRIAYVSGDDLLPRLSDFVASGLDFAHFETGEPIGDLSRLVSANAYLGCWGIVEALNQGADIVITGRTTDAAVVCGPAAWHHQWKRDDWDALAGAVVAGHIIECGTQATGGNYSFFTEVPDLIHPGFPWAEIAADGSSVIGKHDNTAGEVSIGTVTSQLLYEITGPEYLGPDVTARFDTIELAPAGPDRVRVSGTQGQPPPATLKVAMNELAGFRNEVAIGLTGLDIEKKAQLIEDGFWHACPLGPEDFASATTSLARTEHMDPTTNEAATALWRLTLKDPDERKVGRLVFNATNQLGLASIPGFFTPTAASEARPYGVYRPSTIPAELVPQEVAFLDGTRTVVDSHLQSDPVDVNPVERAISAVPAGNTVRTPIGALIGTRSGDKGGNANVGAFARSDEGWAWLDDFLTTERLRDLLPETQPFHVERFRFPAIRSLNFVIHGLLQEGVAASTRQDAQAKSLGEWLRARVVDMPEGLLT